MSIRELHPENLGTIQGDHSRLRVRLEWLSEELAAAGMTPSQTDRELAQTAAELESHFDHEESGGFFAQILDLSPELDERVRNLLREHQEMRQVLRSLQRTCRWACAESGQRAGWLAEFADFRRRFDQHEAAEHELLHQALLRDLGEGD